MKISTIGRYATCALICLAEQYGKGPVSLKTIATDQSISLKYLENIMRILIAPGIVTSTRGKSGGFMLKREPKKIFMDEVICSAEGIVMPIHCMENSDLCPRRDTCPAKYMWNDLKESLMKSLHSVSLYDLASHKKKLAGVKVTKRKKKK
ncbi:MAG: Rrf2 family transcriptional regulator [Spirochaetes bacterium]|nr:Rrf2 family transcriptional regulator [Spirochaetota bacterium]